MGDAADEIDPLTKANVQGQERADIAAKNHPQRPCRANGQRRRHARRGALPQQDPAKASGHNGG